MVIDLENMDPMELDKVFDTISELAYKPSKIIIIRHTNNQKFPFDVLKNSLSKLFFRTSNGNF